jgi:hypothetical protein
MKVDRHPPHLLDALQVALLVQRGHSQAAHGRVQARHVVLGPEEAHLALLVLVGLHALEALQRVVQSHAGGGHGEVLELRDHRGLPALLLLPVHLQHVVREGVSKQ